MVREETCRIQRLSHPTSDSRKGEWKTGSHCCLSWCLPLIRCQCVNVRYRNFRLGGGIESVAIFDAQGLTWETRSVDWLSPRPIMLSDVASLYNKSGDNSVEQRIFITKSVLSSGQFSEILRGARYNVVIELEFEGSYGPVLWWAGSFVNGYNIKLWKLISLVWKRCYIQYIHICLSYWRSVEGCWLVTSWGLVGVRQ